MQIIKKMRKQRAIWWARQGPDTFGRYSHADPVEIRCRWEDMEGEFRNEQGELTTYNTQVYVDREMNVGDKLKLGAMESFTPADPSDVTDAYDIQGFEITPTLNNRKRLYLAYL